MSMAQSKYYLSHEFYGSSKQNFMKKGYCNPLSCVRITIKNGLFEQRPGTEIDSQFSVATVQLCSREVKHG